MSISRLTRFIAAFAAGVKHRLIPRPMGRPNTIAIIQFGKLGDLVCTTPMFRAVKNACPDSRLLVVCRGAGAAVIQGNADIDEVVRYDRLGFWGTVAKLRGAGCSFATMTNPDFNGLALLLISDIPVITAPRVVGGYCPQETKSYRFLRRFVHAVGHRMGHYAPREYLKLLEPAGIHSEDTTKYLSFSGQAHTRVTSWLRQQGVADDDRCVGIAPAAGNRVKIWPADRFARVAEHIAEQPHTRVILVAGPGEQADSGRFNAALRPGTPISDATALFDIDELKALIAELTLFVSVDTGPIYIAEAFGIPTVDIVGPMDEHEQPPQGPLHISVVPPGKRVPQLHIMNAAMYDETEARRQAESIPAASVIQAVDALLKSQ